MKNKIKELEAKVAKAKKELAKLQEELKQEMNNQKEYHIEIIKHYNGETYSSIHHCGKDQYRELMRIKKYIVKSCLERNVSADIRYEVVDLRTNKVIDTIDIETYRAKLKKIVVD